jgi:sec-independent protein translocase protein TatA
MIGRLGPTELIIILIIVLVLFGAGRITKIAGELGSGIKEFRAGLRTEGDADAETEPEAEVEEVEA